MTYLLDTNVVSEPLRPRPDRRVVDWLDSVPARAQYISVLTWGEMRFGIERLPPGKKREKSRLWLEHTVSPWFAERLLPVSRSVVERWSRLRAEAGRTLPVVDSLLAATALEHDLRIVTRNVSDFHGLGLDVLNPWDE